MSDEKWERLVARVWMIFIQRAECAVNTFSLWMDARVTGMRSRVDVGVDSYGSSGVFGVVSVSGSRHNGIVVA